ncbi:HDOD domain-containing protein [Alkalimarinus coralli]|uniref:HDOD domain-containing protein n=1 Tax=Alkalimarinus coralli TaxID=2935863 RepID=UPI00202AE906|nr:HDOD domain-containing protein [Alkalimarinus coralli]
MGTELTSDQIKHILQGIKIPPQPQILVDLQIEQVMPDPDMKQIARLISQDVGLSGTMLKFVNSPFFGLANKITSIEQAVSLLGLNSVINILNGLSIKGEMSDEKIQAMTRFWDTANDIAMVCATVAKQIGFSSPDEAYAMGLFHNSGIPLMMQRFDNYLSVMEEGYAEPEKRIIDVENRVFNTNHAVVGYYTAKSWNLPLTICDVIAEHHSADSIFGNKDGKSQEKKTLLAILKIAEHICCNYNILGGQTVDHEWERINKDILEYVGLSTYDIEDMKANFKDMGISVGL